MTGARSSPENPYRGLDYYDVAHTDFFAGRRKDTKRCARALMGCRVLILHGRSGCGKSSFLRAGVKPYLARSALDLQFSDTESGFDVIRSTARPLRAFAEQLLAVVEDLAAGKSAYGRLKRGIDGKAFHAHFQDPALRREIGRRGIVAFQALAFVADATRRGPIFVIDQAEEVFSQREMLQRKVDSQDESPRKAELIRDLEETRKLATEYFDFIRRVASRGAGAARLVISLRTEYKGQFDQAISESGDSVQGVKGFFLGELTAPRLVEAIQRPTLKKARWDELRESGQVVGEVPPYERYRFTISDEVAHSIARMLSSNEVPEGGVLPTLQVACYRLWRQAEACRRDNRPFAIEDGHVRLLGRLQDQVGEFLTLGLQDACDALPWPDGADDAVEQWHSLLKRRLVNVQPDGRAVTERAEAEALAVAATSRFTRAYEESVRTVLERLRTSEWRLLKEEDGYLSLGHDSVALALNKWSLRFESDRPLARMSMSDVRYASTLTSEKLFPRSAHGGREMPLECNVFVPRDYNWDRLFPAFAARERFAARLGINIVHDDPHLSASAVSKRVAPKSWDNLRSRLLARDDRARELRRKGTENRRVLVAADWHSFPEPIAGNETKADLERRRKRAARWSDILVTDLFTGHGLIGSSTSFVGRLEDIDRGPREERPERYKELIADALREIVEQEGQVRCYDRVGHELLTFAAGLANVPEFHAYSRKKANFEVLDGADYRGSGSVLDWLLDVDRSGRPRYVVGTALTCAMALQASKVPYFNTSHVTLLVRGEVERAKRSPDGIGDAEKDLIARAQKVIRHTAWQLGVPPMQWSHGLNRALVLRLASVGYFTTEYIRSNVDEFVRYLKDYIDGAFAQGAGGESERGFRISRDAVKRAFGNCYSLLKFDEYGTEFYDPDSTVAYWTDHAELDSKSVASEIYNELAALRQRTLANFETVGRSVAWLRERGAYNLGDPDVAEAVELKECAWNHFRIYNFYDSARFMAEAALKLQKKMEGLGGEAD